MGHPAGDSSDETKTSLIDDFMKARISVALIGVMIIILGALIYPNMIPDMVRHWRVERVARQLATSLKADSRYSNVRVYPVAKNGGYIQCSGFVADTNTFEVICEVFKKYSSRFPIRNHVLIVPGGNQ